MSVVRAPCACLQELQRSLALWPGWERMEPASAGCEGQRLLSEGLFVWPCSGFLRGSKMQLLVQLLVL